MIKFGKNYLFMMKKYKIFKNIDAYIIKFRIHKHIQTLNK
jgi:hypothetical protein